MISPATQVPMTIHTQSGPPLPPPPRFEEGFVAREHKPAPAIVIDLHQYGLEEDDVTPAHILEQILERDLAHINCPGSAPFTLNDVKMRHFDLLSTDNECEMHDIEDHIWIINFEIIILYYSLKRFEIL